MEQPNVKPNLRDLRIKYTHGDYYLQTEWARKNEVTWDELTAILTHHQVGKKEGTCIVPAILREPKRQSIFADEISVAAYDSDCGHPLDEIVEKLSQHGYAAIIYSTYNHLTTTTTFKMKLQKFEEALKVHSGVEGFLITTKGYLRDLVRGAEVVEKTDGKIIISHKPIPKFRVVLPLDRPWRAADYPDQDTACDAWEDLYLAGANHLGIEVDESCSDPARLFFPPRHADGAEFVTRAQEGSLFPLLDLPTIPKPKDEPQRAKPIPSASNNGSDSVIGAFNERHEIQQWLKKHDYQEVGRKWLSPNSQTGMPGISIKEGRLRCYHESDPLFTPRKIAHDCFGVYRILEHGGDLRKAVRGAAILMGFNENANRDNGYRQSGSQANQTHRQQATEPDTEQSEPQEALQSNQEQESKYQGVIEELNKRHAIVMLGGRCVVMNEFLDPVFNRPAISFSSVSDCRNFYSNQVVMGSNHKGETTATGLARIWLGSSLRRQYKGIVFDPRGESPEFYNLFRGFAVEPQKGDWSLIKKHALEIICKRKESLYHWTEAWMADLVQNPGIDRPGTSLVIRGKQGTGKGCYVRPLAKILGSHFLHIIHQNQLTGRFNNHLKDALLVFADEAFWAGDKASEGILKGMITEPAIMVEPKGKDAFSVRNLIRLIVASNDDWVVPAGLEERRFCVLDIADDHMQDTAYFAPLFHQIDNGGPEAMLYDLLRVDISSVDLRHAPKTDALLDQIEATMDAVTRFWFERLMDGRLSKQHNRWHEHVITETLYRVCGVLKPTG